MKRMFFLVLTLMVLSMASVNAQVKIGGNGTTGPVAGAVLELDGAQGALLLPRVGATSEITQPVQGMQVYVTSKDSAYIYDGTKWNVYAGPAGPKGDKGEQGVKGADATVIVRKAYNLASAGILAGATASFSITLPSGYTLVECWPVASNWTLQPTLYATFLLIHNVGSTTAVDTDIWVFCAHSTLL